MPTWKTVFMFSGQGSQYFQMGRELFEHNPVFRDWMLRLDGSAREQLGGRSVIEAIYSSGKKGSPFDRTLLTHPAIFMVEYSLAQCLLQAGIVPHAVLGASLGSFAAAAVAGAIAVEDALAAVIQQATILEARCEPGGMLAALAHPALFEESFLRAHSELAGVNFATHFVVSSLRPELDAIEAALRRRDIAFQRLPVSFAFHSRWVEPAKAPFESFMKTIGSTAGSVPMLCCERAAAVQGPLDGAYFWRVLRHPIRFRETIGRLQLEGPHRYVDVGPAGTLATFVKYGLPADSASTTHAVLTPFGQDQKNLAAVLATCRS